MQGEHVLFRRAELDDIPAVAAIYDEIHAMEESGKASTGWKRGIYPTEKTALEACNAGELFVEVVGDTIVASARINQVQPDAYRQGNWSEKAEDSQVMVLHTLTVSPSLSGRGYGSAFMAFCEKYTAEHGLRIIRIDTNEINTRARELYRYLGYKEAGVVPCEFNGLKDVNLVLLEKRLQISDEEN